MKKLNFFSIFLLFIAVLFAQNSWGQTTYFSENFDGTWVGSNPTTAPSGWTQVAGATGSTERGWDQATNTGASSWTVPSSWTINGTYKPASAVNGTKSAHYADFTASSGQTDTLKTGTIDLSTSTYPGVKFSYSYPYSSWSGYLQVFASNDNGSSWIKLGSDLGFTGSNTSWTLVTRPLPSGYNVSTVKIALVVKAAAGNADLWVDDFTIFENTPISAGNKLIGGSGTPDYPTLTAAFADINSKGLAGNINLVLQSGYTSTGETFPIVGAYPASVSNYTVSIYPAVTGLSITSSNTTGTINLNNNKNIIFDGRVNATATTKDLIIENTSTSGYAIQFINDAAWNTIKYCKINSRNTNTTSGTIIFNTTTLSNGNDNNTIDNCDIYDGSSTPVNAIYASGNTSSAVLNNSGNTISNCNIYNFFSAGSATNGIFLTTGNTDWTIDNNKFYQTSSRTYTTGNTHRAIQINNSTSGNNFDIKNNVIGYASNTATGTYTLAGTTTTRFIGIDLAVGTSTATSIQNNTITNFSLATSSGANTTYGIWCGIYISAGNANIGTITGNIIGSTSAIDLISCTPTTSGALIAGISSTSAGTVNINNNNIGALTGLGAAAIGTLVKGILFTSGTITVSGNTIGSISTANSLRAGVSGSTTGVCSTYGIDNSSSGTVLISGNSIGNHTNNGSNVNSVSAGIKSSSGTVTIEKNLIHSINSNSTNQNIGLYGIHITNTSATGTVKNNMIRLGLNADGSNITNGYGYSGINEAGGTNNFYFNSIYIGGSLVTSSANTYAFQSAGSGNPRIFENNIFVNNRSNTSGTAKNYAIKVGTSAGLTCDYNIFYANGTGGVLGSYSTDQTTLNAWRAASSQDLHSAYGNPNFSNSTGTMTSVTPLKIQGTTPAEASGLLIAGITDDIEGNTRSSLTPTDIGADAGDYAASDIFTPTFAYTNLTNTSSTSNRILSVSISDIGTGISTTGAFMPRIWFKNSTTSSSWASTAGVLTSGDGNNSNWNFTVDYSLIGGTPSGNDVIQYYIVAQDQASTPNVWYSPYVGAAHTNVNTQTTAPSTPNSYTILNTYSGNYTIPGAFASLTQSGGLFEKINTGIVSGNITVTIAGDLSETGAFALNQWAEEGIGNYTLTIQSDGTLRTLSNSANLAVPLIKINGADRVTIDGLSGKKLLFRNTNTSSSSGAATIYFDNGSTSCTLTNCIIENNSTSATPGSAIFIGSSGIITNNINITANDIRKPTGGTINDYLQGIYSNSTLNTLTITNNNISDWTTYAIRLIVVADNCTISGNSMYRTTTGTSTTVTVLSVKAGNGHTISGNFIGGTSANCGGSAFTNSANVYFMGIDVSGIGTTSTTNITNNIFQNINLSGTGSVAFLGISGGSAKLNIGNTVGTGNLIGHPSTAQSIKVSGTNTTAFTGIGLNGTGAATVYGVNYNEIANIYVTANTAVKAIDVAAASSSVASITYNNIHDITVFNTGSTAAIRGINNSGTSAGALTISNNTVSNLLSTTTNTGTGSSSAIIGILASSTGNTQNIVNNTISGLNASTTAVSAVKVFGIIAYGATSSGYISKNNIYDLKNSSTGSGYIVGINPYDGAFTLDNNIISIFNGSNTNAITIYGIWDNIGSAGTTYYYFNSVNIGGSAASGALNSYAFNRSLPTTITLKNNIFSNLRTGGTGKHYAIANTSSTPATGWSATASDYNVLYGTAATIGLWNTTDKTYATWQISTTPSQDQNSYNGNPQFASATVLNASAIAVNNKGVDISGITTDYTGTVTRTSPPDMGAYEFSLLASVVTGTSATSITSTGATLSGTVNANNESATGNFEYGLTTSYGSTAAWTTSPVTGTTTIDVTAVITSLQPNTQYHYRINATTPKGTANGSDQTFTTSAASASTFTGTGNWTDASKWSDGLPGAGTSTNATISGTVTVNDMVECNNLTISSSGAVTVGSGQGLIVNGNLLIQSDATGTGSFIGDAADYTITGTSTVERYLTGNKFHQLGLPISTTIASGTSAGQTGDVFKYCTVDSYDETTDNYVSLGSTNSVTPDKGYVVKYVAGAGAPTARTLSFTGALNTGTVNIPMTKTAGGWNLIPNPYPSSIDWNAAGWTKNSTNNTTYIYNHPKSQWDLYDGIAGTNDGVRYIAPGQSFFFQASSAGNLTMTNSVRLHNATSYVKSTNSVIDNLIKIKVSGNANSITDEAVVYFANNPASSGSEKWFSYEATAPSLYTVKSNKNYAINVLSDANTSIAVPLAFKAGANGNYTLKATEIGNFTLCSGVTLEDLKTGSTQNILTNTVYNFTATTTDNANRFVLHFASSVGVNEIGKTNGGIYAYDNNIYVNANEQVKQIAVYNTLGQLVKTVNNVNGLQKINMNGNATGYYIVKVICDKNVYSEKVLVK